MKANIESGMTGRTVKTLHVPFYVPILNPLIHTLLRLGVPVGPMPLLPSPGRKTAKSPTNPLPPSKLKAPPTPPSLYGQANWVRNPRPPGQATSRPGGHTEPVI